MRCFTLKEHSVKAEFLTDQELIRRFRDGEEDAFETIAARYIGLVNSLTKKYRSAALYQDMTDLTQEAMLAMLSAVRSYDESEHMSFKNFLSLCVENRLRSIVRTQSTSKRIPDNNMISIDEEAQDVFDSTQSTVPEMVESKEYIRSLMNLLKDKLSPLEYRATLLYLRGYTYKESAELLKVSEKSVENALSRTRKKMSKH